MFNVVTSITEAKIEDVNELIEDEAKKHRPVSWNWEPMTCTMYIRQGHDNAEVQEDDRRTEAEEEEIRDAGYLPRNGESNAIEKKRNRRSRVF